MATFYHSKDTANNQKTLGGKRSDLTESSMAPLKLSLKTLNPLPKQGVSLE